MFEWLRKWRRERAARRELERAQAAREKRAELMHVAETERRRERNTSIWPSERQRRLGPVPRRFGQGAQTSTDDTLSPMYGGAYLGADAGTSNPHGHHGHGGDSGGSSSCSYGGGADSGSNSSGGDSGCGGD